MVDGARATPRRWSPLVAGGAAALATALAVGTVYGTAVTLTGVTGGAVERLVPTGMLVAAAAASVVVLAASWAIRLQRPRAAVGLALASAALLLPWWSAWPSLPARVRAAALAAPPLAVVGVQLASWPARTRWGTAASALAGLAAVVHLTGYDPFGDLGCVRTCVASRPLAAGVLTTDGARVAAAVMTVVAALGAAALALVDHGSDERVVRAVVCAAALVLALDAGLALVTRDDLANHRSPRLLLPLAALAALAGVLTAHAARTWRARAAVARLASELDAAGPLAGRRGHVTAVHFAVPDEDRWVDAGGVDVSASGDSAALVLSDGAGPAVRLLLDRRADRAEVAAALTPAVRLALRNARLAAVVQTRVDEVRRSRRRVVATSDAERRRIERDLHDGAQQQLVGAAFHLRAAAARVEPEVGVALRGTADLLQDALARLRGIAHGIFPAVLADQGLVAGLEDLVAVCALPVRLESPVRVEVGAETAMAAYAAVAAALAEGAAAQAQGSPRVVVTADAATLRVTIDLPGSGEPDLAHAADRAAALGGELLVERTAGGGARIVAVLPCAS